MTPSRSTRADVQGGIAILLAMSYIAMLEPSKLPGRATGLRSILAGGVPRMLVRAIAGGIGIFIAYLGLKSAGIVMADPGTLVGFNAHPLSPDVLVTLSGLLVSVALHARGICSAVPMGLSQVFCWASPLFGSMPIRHLATP